MNDLTTLRAFLEARNADEKQWDAIDRIEVAIKDAAKAFEFISSNWTTRNLKPSETIRQTPAIPQAMKRIGPPTLPRLPQHERNPMTTTQLDHLRAIEAHLDRLLAIAAKRTPGAWAGDWNRIRDSQCGTVCFANAFEPNTEDTWAADKEYIASCANNAEAGWRSTKAAIALLLSMSQRLHDIETARAGFDSLEVILTEWPLETLRP